MRLQLFGAALAALVACGGQAQAAFADLDAYLQAETNFTALASFDSTPSVNVGGATSCTGGCTTNNNMSGTLSRGATFASIFGSYAHIQALDVTAGTTVGTPFTIRWSYNSVGGSPSLHLFPQGFLGGLPSYNVQIWAGYGVDFSAGYGSWMASMACSSTQYLVALTQAESNTVLASTCINGTWGGYHDMMAVVTPGTGYKVYADGALVATVSNPLTGLVQGGGSVYYGVGTLDATNRIEPGDQIGEIATFAGDNSGYALPEHKCALGTAGGPCSTAPTTEYKTAWARVVNALSPAPATKVQYALQSGYAETWGGPSALCVREVAPGFTSLENSPGAAGCTTGAFLGSRAAGVSLSASDASHRQSAIRIPGQTLCDNTANTYCMIAMAVVMDPASPLQQNFFSAQNWANVSEPPKTPYTDVSIVGSVQAGGSLSVTWPNAQALSSGLPYSVAGFWGFLTPASPGFGDGLPHQIVIVTRPQNSTTGVADVYFDDNAPVTIRQLSATGVPPNKLLTTPGNVINNAILLGGVMGATDTNAQWNPIAKNSTVGQLVVVQGSTMPTPTQIAKLSKCLRSLGGCTGF